MGRLKTWSERRAISRCLAQAPGIRSVCDVPSGPGRLFALWKGRGLLVHGVDVSGPMVDAAAKLHREMGLEGSVIRGDAFSLETTLAEPVDLVASVRFLYYFDHARRVTLMKALAGGSRKYLLLQFRSSDTYRGRVSLLREQSDPSDQHLLVRFCSSEEIISEIREAGLIPLRVQLISEFSDRVYALAMKPDETPGCGEIVPVRPRRSRWCAALVDRLSRLRVAGLPGLTGGAVPAAGPSRKAARRRFKQEQVQQVRSMLERGVAPAEISRQLGIPEDVLDYWRRKMCAVGKTEQPGAHTPSDSSG